MRGFEHGYTCHVSQRSHLCPPRENLHGRDARHAGRVTARPKLDLAIVEELSQFAGDHGAPQARIKLAVTVNL